MNCERATKSLAESGRGTLEPELRRHLEECAECREFAAYFEDRTGAAPAAAVIERIEKGVTGDLKPVKALAASGYFFAAFAAIFLVVGALGTVFLRANGFEAMSMGQRVAIFATLGASAALLAYSLVEQMVPGSRNRVRPALLPVGLFVLASLVVAAIFQIRSEAHFVANGVACLKAGVAVAIPAAILFWAILRRGAVLTPRVAGAAVGMLAGLVGTSVLEMHCPNLNMWHIMMWHLAPALLGAVAGLTLGWMGERLPRN